MLRELVAGSAARPVSIPTEGLEVALIRTTADGEKPAVFVFIHGGPFRTMLFQKLAELVAASDRLIGCPLCGEPFLALRKMKFCGPKCAERWHDKQKIARRKAAADEIARLTSQR